ncbi:MAG: PAS domain S-box protein [Smithellaceae bacterium]|jgi:PAS domain S-box-containing protein/putative nucleotidyltransferase with HDIG domain
MAKKVLSAPSKLKPKISKPQLLRVLVVEDSEDDALLIIRELKKGGYNPVYERMETAPAMKKALSQKPWDIILCDYKLPKFNAPSAITVLKETNIDIPLIIVSGTIGEETAVECMRSGAKDYVMKSNLSRLCPAIKRELEEAKTRVQRKRAEEALQVSEEKYRAIIENMQEGYFELDLAGNFTFVNDAECINLRYPREELIGMNNRQYQDETNAQKMYQLFRELYRTGEPVKALDVEIIRKNGTKGFNEISVSLVRDAEGKPIGFWGVSRDVTERKQAEQALRESEAQYRLLADNMQDQVWLMDLNLKPTYISPSVEKIRGYTFEEIAQLPLDKQLTATSLQSAMEFFSIEMPKALADPTYFALPLELEFYCKDGSTLWVESTFSQVRDENGKPLSLLGVGRDITERKRTEEALHKSEHLHRVITNNIRDTVALLDINFRATWINPSVTKTLGFTLDELAQVPLERQVTPDSMQRMQDLMLEHLTAENLTDKNKELNVTGEFEFYRKNGDIFWDEMNISLLRDTDGKPTGFLTVGRDITERKRAEEERKQSFERMRKALRATVQAISLTVEMKDPYTSGHQRRVSDLARAIATEMGLSADRRDFIRTAATIHDIGKIAIPSEILSKPTKLTDLEFSLIKTHAQAGYDILKDIEFPWPVADVVLQHHERMDGSGYPQGLKGANILLEARILAIADVVEAIASHRPYRPAFGIDIALKEISDNKGILYDAVAVDACLKLFREKGYGLVLKK